MLSTLGMGVESEERQVVCSGAGVELQDWICRRGTRVKKWCLSLCFAGLRASVSGLAGGSLGNLLKLGLG